MIVKIGSSYFLATAIVSVSPTTPWQAQGWEESLRRWVGYGPVKPRVRIRTISGGDHEIEGDLDVTIRAWQEALGIGRAPTEGVYR